jgi:hypothetical protein
MTSLKDDILAPVRQKLVDENQQLLVKLPSDLEAKFVKSGGRTGSAVLTGAAGTKLQFVAAVPAAIAAGILEYLGGPRAGGN